MNAFIDSNVINLPNRYWYHKKSSKLDPRPKYPIKTNTALEKFHQFASENLPKGEARFCQCGSKSENPIICDIDRTGWPLELRLCNNCGLIYVGRYWNEQQLSIFYKDWYRFNYEGGIRDPEALFNSQVNSSMKRSLYSKINNFLPDKKTLSVVDIGGACGGALIEFLNHGHHCVVADFDVEYLNYAKEKKLTAIEGGLDAIHQSGRKYDIVILNHVLEHLYDLNDGLSKIGDILTNKGMLWLELPALDSLLEGRRSYDFLREVQDAHTFYFTLETLSYYLLKHGFRSIYMTSETEALFVFDRSSINLDLLPQKNQARKTAELINKAEFLRRYVWPIRRPIGQLKRCVSKAASSCSQIFRR